jgi:hypothetical protein
VREAVSLSRLQVFLKELSRAAREPTRLYLTGGASQLVRGLRESTVVVDLTFEPESDDVLRSVVALKERLNLNVELALTKAARRLLPEGRRRTRRPAVTGGLLVGKSKPD